MLERIYLNTLIDSKRIATMDGCRSLTSNQSTLQKRSPLRKNFMFADTESGAVATGRVFSVIETARANGHNPQHYLSVLLAELPNVKSIKLRLLDRCS